MSDFIDTIHKEWAVISGAPRSLAAVILVVGATIFGFLEWIHSTQISGKDAKIELQKEQIDSYKDKLSGASPDEAKAKIADLEARLSSVESAPVSEETKFRDQVRTLTQQLDVATKERDQARQQLASQAPVDNSALKPVESLSDDDKQFRNDLRKFILSTLQAHYDAFYGLVNVASGGPTGGPAVSAELKPRADAAYTLVQDGLVGDFANSWRELKDATNTSIDLMNVTNIVESFRKYVNSYQKAVTHFKDYLIIVGSAEDKMNLLPKWNEADAQAKHEFQNLTTYPHSVTSGLENVGFPAQWMGTVSPYLETPPATLPTYPERPLATLPTYR